MEPLRLDQQRAAALTLAEAFANDPLLEIVAPDPGRRARIAPAFMAVPWHTACATAACGRTTDAPALAIWLHPEGGR